MGNEHNKQVDDPVVDGDKCQGRVRERGPGVRAGFVFKRSGQGRSRRCTGRFAGDKGLGHASAGKSMAGAGVGDSRCKSPDFTSKETEAQTARVPNPKSPRVRTQV